LFHFKEYPDALKWTGAGLILLAVITSGVKPLLKKANKKSYVLNEDNP